MKKVTRDKTEFEAKFYEQVALLLTACRNYDEGNEYTALSIAVCLRTLFYDNPKSGSISALSHIDKRNIDMLDTSLYIDGDFNLGLLLKQFSTPWTQQNGEPVPDVENHRLSYIPFCHSMVSAEKYESATKRWSTIENWLSQEICTNKKIPEAKLSRNDFIKITADRDGGAHIDKSVDANYNYFRFSATGLSEKDIQYWQDRQIVNIPIYPILRQMAFEVLYSFKNAGLIKKDVPLVWSENFKVLNAHIKNLTPHYGYWLNMIKNMRLLSPDELNPQNTIDTNRGNDFSVGRIQM